MRPRPKKRIQVPQELVQFTIQLARGAGRILLRKLGKLHHIQVKENAGIVTEADKQAEDYLIKNIFRKYPKSSIITEESGEFQGTGLLTWVLDPLDGTSNYAHSFPWFCVSIGVYEQGAGKIGVVYHPSMNELFCGVEGAGATLNGKKIKVSHTRSIHEALLGTGFYYAKGERLREEMEIFRKMNEVALGVRRPGAAALDLAYVSCGRYDGFWERGLSPWDVAAGTILVKEAGGRVTDFKGKPTNIFSKEILASNDHLHTQLVKLSQ
ncbi:MAG: inositol monophosphatase [Deltaproteobacteria bacterium]|nr:inositol monophosphatase [Deltaproteobacteria bacterium]